MASSRSVSTQDLRLFPSDWEVAALRELGTIFGGATPSRDVAYFWGGEIPWITPGELTSLSSKTVSESREHITRRGLDSCAAHLLPPASLLVTTRATLGSVALAARPIATNQGFKSIFLSKRARPDFYYHLFSGRLLVKELKRRASGTTFLEISTRDFEGIQVPLPPICDQEKIAEVLDTLDDAIRTTEQLIAKLEKVKQGLLHDLLTRGIDENGELRDPVRHPEQFKDSVLGRIPREWSLNTLGDLSLLVTSGSRGWAHYYSETGALFVRIGNLTRKHINLSLEDVVHVMPPSTTEGKRTQLEFGDILISITADLGIIGLVPRDLGEAYVNQHIALVRIEQATVNPRWVAHYLSGHAVQKQVLQLDDSGAKAGLNLPTIRSLTTALPTRAEQDEASARLDALDQQINLEQRTQAKLRLLKQGLMEDLLTGRIRVTPLLSEADP